MSYVYAGLYGQVIQSSLGRPIPKLPVTIYLPGSDSLATLFTGRTKNEVGPNPVPTDEVGNLSFYADPGYYDLVANGKRLTISVVPDPSDIENVGNKGVPQGYATLNNIGQVPQSELPPSQGGGGGDGGSTAILGSGFPVRYPGERLIGVYHELGVALSSEPNPPGPKPVVLAEAWDSPGVLRHIWLATANNGEGDSTETFPEYGGVIRIFCDDDTTPKVEMPIGEFFNYSPMCDVYDTQRMGRTANGENQQTGAFRYLWAPFQKYLRVELENVTVDTEGGDGNQAGVYAVATYSLISNFSDLGSSQLGYYVSRVADAAQAVNTAATLVNISDVGTGQLESIMHRFEGASADDVEVFEGNTLIYVDGNSYPSWQSSGTEDAHDGGWYTIPIGGWPAGRAGDSYADGHSAFGRALYRWYIDNPLFFASALKIVHWVGQPGETSGIDDTVDYCGRVGYWLDTPAPISYTSANDDVAASYTPATMEAGDIPSWLTAGAGDWDVDSDGHLELAQTGGDNYITVNDFTAPDAGYWVEASVAITDASTANQEVGLVAGQAGSTGGAIGNRMWVELKREDSTHSWYVIARNGYDNIQLTRVGSGADLTGEFIDLAMKVIGADIAVYWRMAGNPDWHSLGSFTCQYASSFPQVGICTYGAAAKATAPTVRPLHTVTS